MTDAEPGDQHLQSGASLKFLNTAEVAQILRCSEKTILRRVGAGKLPAIKDGGRYLFEAITIQTLLAAHMVRPKSQRRSTFVASASRADTSNPTD